MMNVGTDVALVFYANTRNTRQAHVLGKPTASTNPKLRDKSVEIPILIDKPAPIGTSSSSSIARDIRATLIGAAKRDQNKTTKKTGSLYTVTPAPLLPPAPPA
ncbi:hypothetical protein Dda_7062 [Drechslerella dactyloides]|uniref:Uncharacterized protein n=1 Tax=Drechslerella dactyloides TaxID=74499 RepID=A0AAD6NH47_DREDA|nr:hypothetical protein Dda_7062 [Drechslerella dactyloides]